MESYSAVKTSHSFWVSSVCEGLRLVLYISLELLVVGPMVNIARLLPGRYSSRSSHCLGYQYTVHSTGIHIKWTVTVSVNSVTAQQKKLLVKLQHWVAASPMHTLCRLADLLLPSALRSNTHKRLSSCHVSGSWEVTNSGMYANAFALITSYNDRTSFIPWANASAPGLHLLTHIQGYWYQCDGYVYIDCQKAFDTVP